METETIVNHKRYLKKTYKISSIFTAHPNRIHRFQLFENDISSLVSKNKLFEEKKSDDNKFTKKSPGVIRIKNTLFSISDSTPINI